LKLEKLNQVLQRGHIVKMKDKLCSLLGNNLKRATLEISYTGKDKDYLNSIKSSVNELGYKVVDIKNDSKTKIYHLTIERKN